MNDIDLIFNNFYNKNIQLSENLIKNILHEIVGKNKKLLIFGMGHDSLLWYKANNEKNIIFVENDINYIKMNHQIKKRYILKYSYNHSSVIKSLNNEIDCLKYTLPKKLERKKPFDIILIDGPFAGIMCAIGREIPFYWSKNFLMHEKTKIFIDDINRDHEYNLLNKYFAYFQHEYFPERNGSIVLFL